jgi:hypothetical protein
MAAYQCLNCSRIERSDEQCCDNPDLFCINDMPQEIVRLRAELKSKEIEHNNLEQWAQRGNQIVDKLGWNIMFNLGLWWADRPWRIKP